MSVIGSPNQWVDLLEHMLPELLQLVIDTWQTLQGPLADDRENEITKIFCRALRDTKTSRGLPFSVQYQMYELDPAPGQDLGLCDIAFLPGPDESIYLCLECKRLNVLNNGKKRRGGSEYVKDGMMRFVNGQYAKAVRHGCMLGYVLDGDVSSAIKNVRTNVRKNCTALCMDAPGQLHPSSILINMQMAKESLHNRPTDTQPFYIHHLFVEADGLFASVSVN